MANLDFDGPSKIITLNSGETSVEAQYIYSEWKRWITEEDNSKYEPAFDTIGGDPLTPGIKAGAYYFLRNDLGWRIRPPEEDTTIYLAGNLTPRDSAYPILISTTGDYNVLVAGLQPITQSVNEILTLQQDTSFNGKIYIDYIDGQSGTAYPIGTASSPVSNFEDGETIANGLGIDTFFLHGELFLPHDEDDFNLVANSNFAVFNFNGYRADGWRMDGIQINGRAAYGNYSSKSHYESCTLSNAGNLAADLNQCFINNTISFATGTFNLSYCVAGENGTTINLHGRDTKLIIRNWAGKLTLISGQNPSGVVLVDSLSSRIILDETCTEGTYSLYGMGELQDETTGSNLNLTNLLSSAARQQEDSYNGQVYIDTLGRGVSGVTYPVGTSSEPSNNLYEAHLISENLGLQSINVNGEVELISGESWANHSFHSLGGISVVKLNNQDVGACSFEDNVVSGVISEQLSYPVVIRDSRVVNVENFYGVIKECGLGGILSFNTGTINGGGSAIQINNSWNITDLPLYIDLQNQDITVLMRNWTGPVTFINGTGNHNVVVESNSSKVTLAPTVANGTFTCYGQGTIVDSSIGTTVVNNLMDPEVQDRIDKNVKNLTALSV